MTTENCEKCHTKFKCEEIGGGQPHKPDMQHVDCPSCNHTVRSALSTGYFKTVAFPQKKQRR